MGVRVLATRRCGCQRTTCSHPHCVCSLGDASRLSAVGGTFTQRAILPPSLLVIFFFPSMPGTEPSALNMPHESTNHNRCPFIEELFLLQCSDRCRWPPDFFKPLLKKLERKAKMKKQTREGRDIGKRSKQSTPQ